MNSGVAASRWGKVARRLREFRFLAGPLSRVEEAASVARIGAEFVRGFRALHFVGPCVTVFGSARFPEGHRAYELAREVGAGLPRAGFTVMTGGGPGGREAASLAYVMSKRVFAGGWEYLLESAIFTAPPTMQWAGAALVNREGKLVGLGSLLVRDTVEGGAPHPGNMFVPIDAVKPILADLIQKGKRSSPPQPWLGLSTEETQGRVFVSRVQPDGPADKAGIKRGDIILAVGKDTVRSLEEFYRKAWAIGPAGIEVPLRILQGADLKDIRVRSVDRFEYYREKPST